MTRLRQLGIIIAIGILIGCGRNSHHNPNADSKMVFGSKEWNDTAAEDLTVRLVAVLQRPAVQLTWINEHNLPQLTRVEQEAIAAKGVTGQMEVVYSTGRGSGSKEVRVVIIQSSPLKANVRLPVPESGSAIYI